MCVCMCCGMCVCHILCAVLCVCVFARARVCVTFCECRHCLLFADELALFSFFFLFFFFESV